MNPTPQQKRYELSNHQPKGGQDVAGASLAYRGQKRYELGNHLGNVLAVITDRRIQRCNVAGVMYYDAQVVSVSDYYPFGMWIKEREWKDSSFGYRFGFQGQEGDDEINDKGNSVVFKYRIHDPRLGRLF